MIPYDNFKYAEIEAIPENKYEMLSLPFVHYRPVKALNLDNRFVLVHNKGIYDTLYKTRVAAPTGPRFFPGSRFASDRIDHLIKPFKISVDHQVWTVKDTSSNRVYFYRDEVRVGDLYMYSKEAIREVAEQSAEIKKYVNNLDLNKALKDHSFDLCDRCTLLDGAHLDFHMSRNELGFNLANQLTGMVDNGRYIYDESTVRLRLFEVIKLVMLSWVMGMRLTIQVGRASEDFFHTECPWNVLRNRRE